MRSRPAKCKLAGPGPPVHHGRWTGRERTRHGAWRGASTVGRDRAGLRGPARGRGLRARRLPRGGLRHRRRPRGRAEPRARPHARGRARGAHRLRPARHRRRGGAARRRPLHRDGADADRRRAAARPVGPDGGVPHGGGGVEAGRHRGLRIHRLPRLHRGRLPAGAGGASGLAGGRDFTVGFSPERINPGDRRHRFETIRKVVSGPGRAHARRGGRDLRRAWSRPACSARARSGWPRPPR